MSNKDLEFFNSWKKVRENGLKEYIKLSMKEFKVTLITLIIINVISRVNIDNCNLFSAIINSSIITPMALLLVIFLEWSYKEYKYKNLSN